MADKPRTEIKTERNHEVILEEVLGTPGDDHPHATATSSIQEAYGPTPYDRKEMRKEERILDQGDAQNPR